MIDLRKEKVIDLTASSCLKEEATFKFEDNITRKKLIAKFIAFYNDEHDEYLIAEFKKLALLSAEPEIATVYFLATGEYGKGPKSCYIMDYIEGNTLGSLLSESDQLSPYFVLDVLSQLASGMQKAHHYEISHGDLHEENILINNFGHVKIIDFLWWDFNLSFQQNAIEDIKSFKILSSSLISKLIDEDKKRIELISNYLEGITSFNEVSKNINILEEISVDLSLIDEPSKLILSKIISQIIPNATLGHVILERDIPVPDEHVSELTEEDKKYMVAENNGRIKLKYSDTRGFRTQDAINKIFNIKLHQLKQAGFIDWQMALGNSGKKFIGPYTLSYQIFFTTKLFRYMRLNQEFEFLEKSDKSFLDLILE